MQIEKHEIFPSTPYFNLIISTLTLLVTVFIRIYIFDVAMSKKFDDKTKIDDEKIVVLSLKNKITIKIISIIANIIIMIFIKKYFLADFLSIK
jgi:hypothetical protein